MLWFCRSGKLLASIVNCVACDKLDVHSCGKYWVLDRTGQWNVMSYVIVPYVVFECYDNVLGAPVVRVPQPVVRVAAPVAK